jgi:LPXTG-motif cell wall-anchored protein
MLRKIAAGTSAAVVAAGLAAAPAVASELPASSGDSCGDVTRTGQNGLDQQAKPGFLFGPLADVPHLLSGDRACFTVAPTVADISSARRNSSAPPPVGSPVPEVPTSPPPDDSGPPGPGPDDSGPPPSTDTSSPPAPPEFTPMMAPPPAAPAPTTKSWPAVFGGPAETVLPAAQPPSEAAPRLPQTANETRPITVAGGASLFAAGLAWIGGARRRRKRQSGPAQGS